MKHKATYPLYRIIKWLVWLFYPKMKVHGTQHLPETPSIVVGNHAKMNGPISCELYFPGHRYTWCASQMMHLKEVPAYAFQDFWSQKPRAIRWFYRFLSYLIAPLSVCVFTNANTIGVYRDTRLLSTFRDTVKRIQEGASVVIFPEHDVPHNHILCEFQDSFIDIARTYYKKTGTALPFVPLYIAPALKGMYLGEPVYYNPTNQPKEERARICQYLAEEITRIAENLPPHKVVPYNNIPKRAYPTNISSEVTEYEDTRETTLEKTSD